MLRSTLLLPSFRISFVVKFSEHDLRSQFVASKIVEYYGWPGLHLREREQFLPEVFYGGPDMIKCIVDDQEPVMDIRCCAHIYRCVLVVVPFYVKTQVIVNSLGVYCSEHTSAALSSNARTVSSI